MNAPGISQADSVAREYVDFWIRHISDALAERAGENISVKEERTPVGSGMPDQPGIWIRLFGGKAGEQAFFLKADDTLRLSQLIAGEPLITEAELTDGRRERVVQLFNQIAGTVSVSEWLGFDGELAVSASDHLEWEAAWREDFELATEQGPLFTIQARLSSDFASALKTARESANHRDQSPQMPSRPPSSRSGREANLDLLLEVELEATLRFGQRELLLGDILSLSSGSVVELDRHVNDPVELLVGGKVIAWGELVTVEGKYALHVTGLASREERIESLRR